MVTRRRVAPSIARGSGRGNDGIARGKEARRGLGKSSVPVSEDPDGRGR